ncbi:MAG: putative S-adenosyl-L-methionine-dependent methyltransferase TehB [Syntrophorhabdus sp. PtaU1.Bin002]|nr:MAG: putative S-adenosyl-L-methionine-dependent methyltransferase TehB [Syntrophorhabdus sp. PtaB.Bin006]OPY71270.1 MAG: putative S-adenosyl-L-methionine-dependent methyltransferase TehB [Syntrophorhabdus sp. PtaU1.Bin002]
MDLADWDRRHREGFYEEVSQPNALLERFWHVIPAGRVLDVATGNGRNTVFLAEKGYDAWGIDRSSEALRRARQRVSNHGAHVSLVLGDAADLPFKGGSMTGVIVFYFLLRDKIDEMVALLTSGGILIYETLLKRQNTIDRHRNPDYLLDDGELISYFRGLDLLFYEETISGITGKKRATAQYVGRKK